MRILVADDSAVLRKAVRRLLEQADFEVVEAEDGVDAITRFYEQRPNLVLLDVTMPRLTGYVVCRLIKEDPVMGHIPVLILTGRDSAEDRYWADRSGADGFITKDALGDGLVQIVQQTLATSALTELSRAAVDIPALGETDVLTRVCEMLDRKLFEATVVNEIIEIGARSLRFEETIAAIIEQLGRLVSFDVAGIALVSVGRLYATARDRVGNAELDEVISLATRHLRAVVGPADDRGLDLVLLEGTVDDSEPPRPLGSIYATALLVHREVVGMLVLAGFGAGAFPDQAIRTMRTIESAVATIVDAAWSYEETVTAAARANLSALSGY
jgi:CheY-like chemotaxis protein